MPFERTQITYEKNVGKTIGSTPDWVYDYFLQPGESGRVIIDYVMQDILGNKKAGIESVEVRRPLVGNCIADNAKPVVSPSNNQVLNAATYSVVGGPESVTIYANGIAGKEITWSFIFDVNTAPRPTT